MTDLVDLHFCIAACLSITTLTEETQLRELFLNTPFFHSVFLHVVLLFCVFISIMSIEDKLNEPTLCTAIYLVDQPLIRDWIPRALTPEPKPIRQAAVWESLVEIHSIGNVPIFGKSTGMSVLETLHIT